MVLAAPHGRKDVEIEVEIIPRAGCAETIIGRGEAGEGRVPHAHHDDAIILPLGSQEVYTVHITDIADVDAGGAGPPACLAGAPAPRGVRRRRGAVGARVCGPGPPAGGT